MIGKFFDAAVEISAILADAAYKIATVIVKLLS